MKKQPKEWDKILTIHISDKQLTFNYIKNSYNSTVIIILLKMGRKTYQTISKKTYQVYKKMLSTTNHLGNASQNHNEISPHTC